MMSFLANKNDNIEDKPVILFIYENYRNVMLRVAKSIVCENHLAEDVVQEAFERIIKKIDLIKKVKYNALRSYTILIVKSIAYNLVARENKCKTVPFDDFSGISDMGDLTIEDITIQNELVDSIKESLDEIGISYATPMILRYYYGFSDKETAELLDIKSAGTVRSLCFRGKRLILEKIEKAGRLND